MSLEQLYDKIASRYNTGLNRDVLAKPKEIASKLISQHRQTLKSILGLGVGDGSDLIPLSRQYPHAELHGIDLSANMLDRAKTILHQTYQGDISKASSISQKNDFDLITIYFVTAYVPFDKLLVECQKLLAADGLVCFVGCTMESFKKSQSLIHKLETSSNLLIRFVAQHVKKIMRKFPAPRDAAQVDAIIKQHHMTTVASEFVEIPFRLDTEKEIYDFFIGGGWFNSGLMHPWIPVFIGELIARYLIHKIVKLPFEDTIKVAIALASR